MEQEYKPAFLKYLSAIVKWRIFILRFVLIAIVSSAIISLIIPPRYTATATILPPSPLSPEMGLISMGISEKLSGLGGISNLLPGFSTSSDLFAEILESGRIKSEIINRFNLMAEFKAKNMEEAIKNLEKITTIDVSREGIISVSICYKNKYLAADIANAYFEELNKFNNEIAMTTGKKYRIFIEQRLGETHHLLTLYEDSLKIFQEKHRTIALDEEVKVIIETIAKLKSEIILREVQKGAFGSAEINNPYVSSLNQELKELKRQLSRIEIGDSKSTANDYGVGFSVPLRNLPALSLEYIRLYRNVKIQEAVYELLTQQYEQAKIMEAKDTPTVQFIDRASPPIKRSYPHRTKIVIFVAITSLLLGIFLVYFLEYLQLIKKNSEFQNHYKIIKQDLRNIQLTIQKIFMRKSK